MLDRQSVLEAVAALAANPSISDAEMVTALESAGFDHVAAERLTVFVPLAFGRVLLESLRVTRFSRCFRARTRLGLWTSLPLDDQPAFTLATDLARQAGEIPELDRDTFRAIAVRSTEVQAASLAIGQGEDISAGKVCRPDLSRLTAEQLGYVDPIARLTARLRKTATS